MFRKEALENISNPEDLDNLITVTKSRAYLSLLAIFIIIIGIIIWSVFGNIYSSLSGRGIILKQGGIFEISVLGTGIIEKIKVKEGDIVKKGDIVALISQAKLQQQLNREDKKLAALNIEKDKKQSLTEEKINLEIASMNQKLIEQDNIIKRAEERIKYLRKKLKSEQEALKLGILTEADAQKTKQEIDLEKNKIEAAAIQKKTIDTQKYSLKREKEQEIISITNRIDETKRVIEELKFEIEEKSKVISPYEGKVVEIKSTIGSLITASESIMSLEPINKQNKAFIFIQLYGKKIQNQMPVQISPVNVKKERYGYLLGKVEEVSDLPATKKGLMKMLRNEILVNQIIQEGAPFIVQVSLVKDSKTYSGYKWSSSKGPNIKIESGTICEARIIIEKSRPIFYVFPALKTLVKEF